MLLFWHKTKAYLGFPENLKMHPIEDLGIGPVAKIYRSMGINTIGDFADAYKRAMVRGIKLGPRVYNPERVCIEDLYSIDVKMDTFTLLG
jgi:hypothetical protein